MKDARSSVKMDGTTITRKTIFIVPTQKGEPMRLIEVIIPFIVAVAINWCAYIGCIQGVCVLSASLAFYAAKGWMRGEKNEAD